jgi:hypothetical protein
MAERPERSGPGPGDRITYFMVRIHCGAADDRTPPSGIVERLGSGRKQAFTGTDELIRLLAGEPDDPASMMDPAPGGNK